MKKVAQIAHSAPGGASDLCATLAIAAQADGVRQELAFWGNEPAWPDRMARCRAHGIEATAFLKRRGVDPVAHGPIYRWARAQADASAIIIHYPPALFAVKAALRGPRRPRILLVEHHANALKNARKWLTSFLALRMADTVVYLTSAYRDQVSARLGRTFRPRRCAVIANGVDLERYQAPSTPVVRAPGHIVVGMSARMLPPKDHATLLAAFALACKAQPQVDWHLELAGDGPARPAIESQIAALGLSSRVHLLGMLPHEELVRRLWQWDIGVLSTWGETQSLSAMEAMVCGLPLLATRVTGVMDTVTEGSTGLLVPPGNPTEMAGALERLALDPALRAQLRAHARAHAASQFSAAAMWSRYCRLIEQGGLGREREGRLREGRGEILNTDYF